ncbi:cytochrome c [Roseibium salinum]|nr:cytochrome c [Roseibium salinum]
MLFLCLAVVVASASGAAVMYQPIDLETDMPSLTGDPGRGAYLARMAGCIGCHTNGEQGGAPLAGGLALDTGFGTFYSPNLTTDPEKGIGDWSLDDFARAVRHGISPDGKPYYPAFPYPFYAKLSDQDIADLWAAFQTVPPAGEPSVDHDLSFPFGIREGLKLWRAAYLEETPFVPDPEKNRRNGTAASSLWKVPPIAARATRRAMPWEPGRCNSRFTGPRVCPTAASHHRSPAKP